MAQTFELLEQRWGQWAGLIQTDPTIENVVSCSSGTAALHLAIEAFWLPLGSQILMPNLCMVACARAVAMAGLTPVFVDCDDHLNIKVDCIEKALTYPRLTPGQRVQGSIVAILAVHTYGRRCDMTTIHQLAQQHNLLVIEDMAEIHGVSPHPATHAACWSFYRNKIVHGEEGGAVWFADHKNAQYARSLRSLGFTEAHDFNHIPRGHNYRMSNVHAQLILDSLDQVEQNTAHRRNIEKLYEHECHELMRMPARQAVWVYDMKLPYGMHPEKQNMIVAELKKNGIESRHCFKPMTKQVEFQHCKEVKLGEGPSNADWMSKRVFYLPVTEQTTEVDVVKSCRIIEDVLKG